MTLEASTAEPRTEKPLSGVRAWIISDGKAGMDTQTRGVADALGLDYEMKRLEPQGLGKFLAPYCRVPRRDGLGVPGSPFAPPWPSIVIATGRQALPYLRAIKRAAGAGVFTVVLLDPRTGVGTADLIWVPEHDRLRGSNVITTLTSPHSFTQARIAELRQTMPPEIAALPRPRIAVMLGGKNAVYKFTLDDDRRLTEALGNLAETGASFMVTPSRRTHRRLMDAVECGTRGAPRIIWDRTGANPYADFLAHADQLIVTADSVNMTGEACATGRPVYVFNLSAGSAKFNRFHALMQAQGFTRPLAPGMSRLETWSYTPPDAGSDIAREIERRFLARARMLPGHMGAG